jgi:hypothetical protein
MLGLVLASCWVKGHCYNVGVRVRAGSQTTAAMVGTRRRKGDESRCEWPSVLDTASLDFPPLSHSLRSLFGQQHVHTCTQCAHIHANTHTHVCRTRRASSSPPNVPSKELSASLVVRKTSSVPLSDRPPPGRPPLALSLSLPLSQSLSLSLSLSRPLGSCEASS